MLYIFVCRGTRYRCEIAEPDVRVPFLCFLLHRYPAVAEEKLSQAEFGYIWHSVKLHISDPSSLKTHMLITGSVRGIRFRWSVRPEDYMAATAQCFFAEACCAASPWPVPEVRARMTAAMASFDLC